MIRTVGAVLANFGPLVAFYVGEWGWGLKAGIAASAVWSIAEVLVQLARGQKLTGLFKFTVVTTLVLGGVDLWCTSPRFFSYEPVFTNVLVGGWLGWMLWRDATPMFEAIYEQRPELRAERADVEPRMRLVLALFVAYSALKAVGYFWVAQRYAVDEAMGIRAVLGNASLVPLFALIWFGTDPMLRVAQRLGYLRPVPVQTS